MGKLSPQITTEVDCESLLSKYVNILNPNLIRTTSENFERLVMVKHHIDCVYCCPEKMKNDSSSNGRVRILMIRNIQMILPFWTSRNRNISNITLIIWGCLNLIMKWKRTRGYFGVRRRQFKFNTKYKVKCN